VMLSLCFFESLLLMQPGFECSSKGLKNILLLFSHCSGLIFCFQDAGVEHRRPTGQETSTNHWHTNRHWGERFIFLIYCRYKVKKGKN
jgi:hypothetical protein